METQCSAKRFAMIKLSAVLFAGMACFLLGTLPASAAPLTINVVGVAPNGAALPDPVISYRWTVEEDATKASIPGKPADTSNYSFSMHTSYMPVVAAGRAGAARGEMDAGLVAADPDVARIYNQTLPNLDPAKRYYVSIAAEGFQMGGAPVVFSTDGTSATATVFLNQYDLPTAQLSIFVFNDNNPINGAPDLPQETGLAGFHIHLIEAGGTYGDSGGEVTQDAFGNPLGTTYSDEAGTVATKGSGIILTDANGVARIKNLYPAKYTIHVDPPSTDTDWHQTSTIEGTRGDDAWVKNNEPSFFQEFGPPGHHVFVGFTRSGRIAQNADGSPVLPTTGGNAITGRVVNTHNSRPPVFTFYKAAPVNECWVGLNQPGGQALYAARCNQDSTFTIPNVPDGTYEVVIWDDPLDMIIGTTTVTVSGSTVAMGDVPVTSWFGRYQGRVFQDIDGTGVPFFVADFDRPHIEVDQWGIEHEVTTAYKKGDLKPSFGDGIASNIRFRDGSIYQTVVTKPDGTFAHTEVFPFFNYMVGEIDYARWKASGATIVVDDGGEVITGNGPNGNDTKLWPAGTGLYGSNNPALAYDPWARLNPQEQQYCDAAAVAANTDGSGNPIDATGCLVEGSKYFRTENCAKGDGQCAILLEAMQTFLGSTNHVEWGKQPYAGEPNGRKGQNGGIAGIVHYAITRAEDDPRLAAAEQWEPGVPRVQVNMYLDCDGDTYPDKPRNDGSGQCDQLSSDTSYVATDGSSLPDGGYKYDPADVDNYPYCWSDPEFATGNPTLCPSGQAQGPEDTKRSRTGGTAFSLGDVFFWGAPGAGTGPGVQPRMGYAHTDSWDDSIPDGCPDTNPYYVPSTGDRLDCFDGLRNFNQVRPAVFDGGYAFGRVAGQEELPMYIGAEGAGTYIVEAVAPPGYLHQGNGDQNVAFGDTLKASTAALPFECVGRELPVPANLTLFPGEPNPNAEAGQVTWRKCDMKAVSLVPGTNPAPDFWLFTEAPVAGHGVGFILDDTTAEFNTYSPNFGEKYAPPHMPISIQDWTGREISRVYSDEFGSYNFLTPSSFTINPPYPSGVMPSMMVACMNHPGPITMDPVTGVAYDTPRIDPFFNRSYSQFCYTLQYLAGKTTYLDTPVVPVAAFANVNANPLDCDCADGTPMIYSANHGTDDGPYVPSGGPSSKLLTILSVGTVQVLNPTYDPAVAATNPSDPRAQKTIPRDYGFGPSGTVTLSNNTSGGGVSVISWSNDMIQLQLPNNGGTGQLTIQRSDTGKQSVVGLTVHRSGTLLKVNKTGAGGAFTTIQAAVEASTGGDVITIAPGTYDEYVILDKRVSLQGWGSGSVFINAAKSSSGGLAAWRALLNRKIDPVPDGTINPDTGQPNLVPGPNRTFDLVPGQTLGFNAGNNEPLLFGAEEGPGVLIVGMSNNGVPPTCQGGQALRVDGVTITGSDAGGAILASGYACDAELSNNRIVSNYGTYGGGIRVGHPALTVTTVAPDGTDLLSYSDAINPAVKIHNNWISQNGATEAGGGGGITLAKGSNGYTVADNYVCGNFSMADGGGLSHVGQSAGAMGTSGGNSGAVGTANLISHNTFIFNQTFNQSADPMGGAVSIAGQIALAGGTDEGTGDVLFDGNLLQGNQAGAGAAGGVSIARTAAGDDILATNNMIINNVAAYAGGGVALTNAGPGVRLVNNTVASNVSTATNRQSFGPSGAAAPSVPQVAGLAVLSGGNPTLLNNIFWSNRSYIYLITGTHSALCDPGTIALVTDPATGLTTCGPGGSAQYRDLSAGLAPRYSVLTSEGLGNTAYLTGTSGCSNTAPSPNNNTARDAIRCNRDVSATSNSLFAKRNEYVSIVDPSQPVILQDQTVYVQPALTFDETGNFVNVIFSPLTLWDRDAAGNMLPTLRADYHLAASPGGAPAVDNGRARNTGGGNPGATAQRIGANFVPLVDIDADSRPTAVDIGADERP